MPEAQAGGMAPKAKGASPAGTRAAAARAAAKSARAADTAEARTASEDAEGPRESASLAGNAAHAAARQAGGGEGAGADGDGALGGRDAKETGQGAGEQTDDRAGAKAGYSSEAATHPFAVQESNQGDLNTADDVLQDPLVNAISPAKPRANEDALAEARELGLDDFVSDLPRRPSSQEEKLISALLQNKSNRNRSHQNGDTILENGSNGHGPPRSSSGEVHKGEETPDDASELTSRGLANFQHNAREVIMANLLDNRLYRSESHKGGWSREHAEEKEGGAQDDGDAKNTESSLGTSESAHLNGDFNIGRTRSTSDYVRAHMPSMRYSFLVKTVSAVEKKAPGILKAPGSTARLAQSSSLSNTAEGARKRQRVRFFIPETKATDFYHIFDLWDPDGWIVSTWNAVLAIAMAYEGWAGAFRLALGTPQARWLQIMDLCMDGLFVVDGLILMNTAMVTHVDGAINNLQKIDTRVIRDRSVIVQNYFKNVFPWMMVPSFLYFGVTFSYQNPAPQEQGANLWLWWIASIPRLVFRVRRLVQYFKKGLMNLNVSVARMQLWQMILILVGSAHWIGCLYFWAARLQGMGMPTWLDKVPTFFPAYEKGTAFRTSSALELFSHYFLCLYRGVDGLVAVGYFPVVPTNSFEMVVAISVQFLAIYVAAYILGTLFHYLLMAQKDALKESQNKKMEELEAFIDERRLPMVTRKRLVEYFEFQYKKAVQRRASAALKLPRSLEVKVANARFSPTLQKCCNKGLGRERGPFFGCSPQFLNAMVTKLRPVFLMPGDQFIRSADMVLELCFVSSGYAEVMDGDTVKRIIRSDVDSPSIVGEVSFYLGVQQQHSVRAPTSSDIELLMLSKEASEDLFRDFPEQQEIISANLLHKYNMDSLGEDLDQDVGEDDEDPDAQAMRQILKDTVKRRHDEAFQALAWAATSGDLEEVRRMLRKGVGINSANYDGKTVLHMAAVEGNFRVVELLLGEGADKNKRDRWGNTALQDAINNNQGPVIQLLVQWKSELNNENAAGRLCDAASAGDLDTLKLILEHGVDPNCGDYDSRTPLHLAAAEGQDKAVQYLIAKGADVNFKDRWGATALQDAVTCGHVQVAEQILSRGGVMTTALGAVAMCNAATEGDVRYLKLLIRCGVDPDVGDYDSRCPMHLAAAEGRLLAVSYLLGVSANPNTKDRWGGTPMDDCVRGGTQRHLQCAKLLQCLGGKLGTFARTAEGHEALSILDNMDMEDVRKVIKLLIDQGLDTKKPERATHQECVVAHEASVDLMQPAQEIKRVFDIVTRLIGQEKECCQKLLEVSCDVCDVVAKFVDKILPAHVARDKSSNKDEMAQHLYANDVKEFMHVLHSGEDSESLDQFFDFEIDAATLALYEELDDILSAQERDKFASRSMRIMLAKEFNRHLMGLFKVEEMWRILCISFGQMINPRHSDSSMHGHHAHLGLADLTNLWHNFDLNLTDEETHAVYRQSVQNSGSGLMTAESLLVGSSTFHRRVLEEESDDIAQLLYRSPVLRVLAWQSVQIFVPHARRVKLSEGQTIRLKERSIIAVHMGSVRMTHVDASGANHVVHVGKNEVAGEAWTILNVGAITSVMANSQAGIILLPAKAFSILFELQPELYMTLCASFIDLVWEEDQDPAESKFRPHEVQLIREAYSKADTKRRRGPDGRQRSLINMDELKELQGKSLDRQRRDEAIRRLMEHVREACQVSWAESNSKPALLAFIQWKAGFVSKRKPRTEAQEQKNRGVLREGFQLIERTWDIMASGANTIFLTELQSLRDHLGEVGVHFFDTAFKEEKMKAEINFHDWIACWLRYLDGDEEQEQVQVQGEDVQDKSVHEAMPAPAHAHVASRREKDNTASEHKVSNEFYQSNWILGKLHDAYVRLRHIPITPLLDDSEIGRAYEPSFVAITGDMKNALDRNRVKEFLALLLIDFDQELTDLHVDEFMDVFSPDGPKGESVAWLDIERELRHRTNKGLDPARLFMSGFGSPINPNSHTLRIWRTLNQFSAIYFFLLVPVRIAFNPYSDMLAWNYVTLSLDLAIDCLTFLNLLITLNTAYMNKKSRWVIDRAKIARHYLSTDFLIDLVVAAPFDWFGYLSGASQRLSSCFRLPKMLWIGVVFAEHRAGLLHVKFGFGREVFVTLMMLHLCSCIFFLIGKDGPNDQFTWWRNPDIDEFELNGVVYGKDNHWPFEYTGFGYQNDQDSSPWFSVWRQYLLSTYWVTSTITTTGVIGDMQPKNYMEVIFTIFLLLLNLTWFSYVIGQVSTNVLKGDEKLLKAREELGAVESYLNSFDFSEDLKKEIKRYFQGANANSFLSASEIFDSVSQSLRLEMSSDLTRKCLDNCMLFSGCSKQMKDSVKGLLREVHFASEEFLVQINTVAHDMYFVMTGKVERVTIDNDGVEIVEARIGPGGSVGILASYFGIRYMYSARATSLAGPCLCLRLVRNQLMPILKAYPDDEEMVSQNAMSEFQKVKQEKSVNGNSTKGRSVKSGARSMISERKAEGGVVRFVEPSEHEDGSDRSLNTAYENDENGEDAEQSVDRIILSGIEQKLASLNQRRKAERIAQFCNAGSRGEIDKIERGMRNGVHIDETDVNGRTALHCAASEGRVETVRYLLEARASVNVQDSYKNTPLNDAVRHKRDIVAADLRKFGASALTLPGYELGVQMCQFAHDGDQDQLHRMLTNGVDVNTADYDKRTALHLASSQGHIKIVEFLISKGAEVNCTDRMGFSPLVDALRHGHVSVQKFLRSLGGQLLGMDVSVELCNAAAEGDVPRMKALIENGANPNAGDYDARTALHLAASNGETSALDYMLRHLSVDINVNPLDRLGGTPIEDAYRHGQMVAVAMLEDAGGLRQDDAKLVAMAEKVHADTEHIQRMERRNKVQDLVQNAPETRACVWVRGRCGKLLPAQLNDLMQLSKDLMEEMHELTGAISEFFAVAKSDDVEDLRTCIRSQQYIRLVQVTRTMSETVKQWRATCYTASGVMAEELPQCKAALIFSREYKNEVKELLEKFKFVTKTLQFWRFLVLKIPEVKRAEEEEERSNRIHGVEEMDIGGQIMSKIRTLTDHAAPSGATDAISELS